MHNEVFELDSLTAELKLNSEKLEVMLQEILGNYFNEMDAKRRNYIFEISRTKVEIAMDYINKSSTDINSLEETSKRIWEKERELMNNKKALE